MTTFFLTLIRASNSKFRRLSRRMHACLLLAAILDAAAVAAAAAAQTVLRRFGTVTVFASTPSSSLAGEGDPQWGAKSPSSLWLSGEGVQGKSSSATPRRMRSITSRCEGGHQSFESSKYSASASTTSASAVGTPLSIDNVSGLGVDLRHHHILEHRGATEYSDTGCSKPSASASTISSSGTSLSSSSLSSAWAATTTCLASAGICSSSCRSNASRTSKKLRGPYTGGGGSVAAASSASSHSLFAHSSAARLRQPGSSSRP